MATILNVKIFNKISLLLLSILIFFQINSSIIPLVKKLIQKILFIEMSIHLMVIICLKIIKR